MWTAAEIALGTSRIVGNKLSASDAETLLGVFKLYLKNLSAGFSDLAERLAAAQDTGTARTASKLAATLILLEENGFDLSELKGGRSGLQTNEVGAMILKIRLSLTLLGYDLPEEFSGSIETGSENISGNAGSFFPSVVIDRKPSW